MKLPDGRPNSGALADPIQISQLQDEFNVLTEERARLTEALRAARTLSGETQGFYDEAKIQAERLESIGLFEQEENHHACPICDQRLENPTPNAEAIHAALSQLSHSLGSAERERPRLRHHTGNVFPRPAQADRRLACDRGTSAERLVPAQPKDRLS
jgi:hypothetical protein